MEEELVARYVREYSRIENLQAAARVCYALTRRPSGLFLTVGRAGCGLAGLTEEAAGRLLLFLYENAIPAEQLNDVVQDLCRTLVMG